MSSLTPFEQIDFLFILHRSSVSFVSFLCRDVLDELKKYLLPSDNLVFSGYRFGLAINNVTREIYVFNCRMALSLTNVEMQTSLSKIMCVSCSMSGIILLNEIGQVNLLKLLVPILYEAFFSLPSSKELQPIQTNEAIVQVSCGINHYALITSKGQVLSFASSDNFWKYPDYAQLGRTGDPEKAEIIESLVGYRIVQVVCGGYHTLFRTDDGQVFSCGLNNKFQLGRDGNRKVPARVKGLRKTKIIDMAAGYENSAVISDQYKVYIFGKTYTVRKM